MLERRKERLPSLCMEGKQLSVWWLCKLSWIQRALLTWTRCILLLPQINKDFYIVVKMSHNNYFWGFLLSFWLSTRNCFIVQITCLTPSAAVSLFARACICKAPHRENPVCSNWSVATDLSRHLPPWFRISCAGVCTSQPYGTHTYT